MAWNSPGPQNFAECHTRPFHNNKIPILLNFSLLVTVRQRSCGKVMLSQVCVRVYPGKQTNTSGMVVTWLVQILNLTSMHSSRMRTTRLLTVSRSSIRILAGGLPFWVGRGLPSHGIVGMQIPHPLEQTNTCEKITLPHTSYAVGKKTACKKNP